MSLHLVLLSCLVVGGVTVVGGQSDIVWTIATGHDWGAHEYIDTEGYIRGFSNELITLICEEAELDCRIAWDKYTNCWISEAGQRPHAGVGLIGRWYDACTGYVQTVERIHTFAFTQAYLKVPLSYFYILKGSSFDTTDMAGKTIGFFDGWFTTEQCLARAKNIKNNVLKKEQIVHIPGPSQALARLKATDGTKIDALLTTDSSFLNDQADQLQKINVAISCALGGNSMMSRSDSDFPAMWNIGFNKARSNGKFLALCEKAKSKHGDVGSIDCVDSY